MNAIKKAVSRLHAYEKSHPDMTPKEKADFIKRELEKSVPAKPEILEINTEGDYLDSVANANWNECRKAFLGE